jgi:hypothetical protein
MSRILFFCVLFFAAGEALGQRMFCSDCNTPLVQMAPCECSSWRSPYVVIDSARRKLKEVPYSRGGVRYKRTYYITTIDSTWTDICEGPGNCSGNTRARITSGFRTWYADVATSFRLVSFTLPCCSDKPVNVSDIANVSMVGPGTPAFSPEVLRLPSTPSKKETVTVTVNGQSLTASIVMINPSAKAGNTGPESEKLKTLNERATADVKTTMANVSNLLRKSLSAVGEWKSDVQVALAYSGEVSNVCDPGAQDCFRTGYRIAGKGEAVLAGRLNIPASQLPLIGQYLGNAFITTNLRVVLPLNVDGLTDGSDPVCSRGSGKLTGSGAFAFRVAGYRAEGQVVVEEGSLSTDLCLWPEVNTKCTKLVAKRLRLVGVVEDRWGLTRWNIDYTLWNGLEANLNDCQ